MKNTRITRNPYLLFLPFLCLYSIYILLVQNELLWGDEIRHMYQVQNLLHGYYSPPPPNVELRNGPGYPLFMLPFVALHVPLVIIRLMNAVMLYLSVVFLFKALIRVLSFRITLLFSFFWACYYNSLDSIALMHSEIMAGFLISALVLLLVKAFEPQNAKTLNKYALSAGLVIGYLALTKVIFGYVILCMLIGCALLWLLNRSNLNYRKGLMIIVVAFATVTPYLAYTYHLTGKAFYWGTSGGDNLYWMSTPYENEYGSWFPGSMLGTDSVTASPSKEHGLDLKKKAVYIPGTNDSLRAHHYDTYMAISKFKGPGRDEAFKKVVVENIKAHPVKFIQNCISNIGRILFNYPYSYTAQKPATLARLPLSGAIVLLSLFCLIPTFLNWKQIIYPVRFLLFFVAIYLGGSIFGSAEVRMFTIIVPALLLWLAYVLSKTVTIKLKFPRV